ncbi:MAG: Stp1/IreP family PP2C-type Ser/Thr phosphatase [Thermoleophilia bacterium]|nr:Stp1/IreP family PP2C-type Ser/Thr phosphatase [Thermoleophilia bacterium]
MTPGLTLVELAHASDTGRVRAHNEDRGVVAPPLLGVADGMGGARAGEVASGMAAGALEDVAGARLTPERLQAAVEQANRDIRQAAAADPSRAGMGTTVTAGLLQDGRLHLVHVGDSRAYLWRGGRLVRLTDDHSVVGEMVRRGTITAEQAERHPHRHVVTRALGADDRVEVDAADLDLDDGDVLLFCSDGLCGPVEDPQIAEVLAAAPDLGAAARGLVEAANAAGGPDNVTVVLARAGHGAPAPVPPPEPVPTHTRRMPTLPRPTVGPDAEPAPIPGRSGEPPAPRVLQQVDRARSRRVPIIIAAVAVVGIGAGALAWAASRTYFVDEGSGGTVHTFHGLPVGLGALHLYRQEQDTGVAADDVRVAEPGALGRTARGQGEATELAARLTWRFGVPAEWPRLRVAPPPPPPPPAPPPATTLPRVTPVPPTGTVPTPPSG